jgi:hypothetical protein
MMLMAKNTLNFLKFVNSITIEQLLKKEVRLHKII